MDVRDFDFSLPPEQIAQQPPAERGGSRLLVLDRETGAIEHTVFAVLPDRLRPGDLVVVNNTRVFPARLLGRRVASDGAVPGVQTPRGAVECLLIADLGNDQWEALMHPGQKLKPGARVLFDGVHPIHGEVVERRFHGRRVIRLWTADGGSVADAIDAIGHMPLPPYIKRPDSAEDAERYQTVFARSRGSVAAPTAGLHLTDALLARLQRGGVEVVEVTLHVGYGTFQPVRSERVEDHRIEPEGYAIAEAAGRAIAVARASGRRVIAVGTTTTRALEAVAAGHDGVVVSGRGSTDLFIYPGFSFRVISGLVTNFHLPRSSLLMLVCAFGGRERVLTAYREAVERCYRFYSYGDAMVIL